MPSSFLFGPLAGADAPDLVERAASILAEEAARLLDGRPRGPLVAPEPSALALPPGAPVPVPAAVAGPCAPEPVPNGVGRGAPDLDRVRRPLQDVVEESLPGIAASGSTEDHAPLLPCAAPVAPGADAVAAFRVANEGPSPVDVVLYCTNFVADSGYEIAAVRVTFSPRKVVIAPRAEASFQIRVAVPAQTVAGVYSGLVQAAGARYAKAVVLVEVT